MEPLPHLSSSTPMRRRSLLTAGAGMAAALVAGQTNIARGAKSDDPTPGDIAFLKFLAAAELVEDDLWQQYCELAVNNPTYNRALRSIDPSLIRYICDDRDDERSHAALMNAYLVSVGEEPVNLDSFRTLSSVPVAGARRVGRLTNLTNLIVDTSWYNRSRGTGNPDFGDRFPQLVNIVNRPTIPIRNSLSLRTVQGIAHSAAFHFCAIEQGGGSLYTNLIGKVRSRTVLSILASIGPTEVYHFATFHKSLEGIYGLNADGGLVFPNLKGNPKLAQATFPEPCTFLSRNFPLCSVIRPSNTENGGAVAAANGLVQSGLFAGQPPTFLQAVSQLAVAADNANQDD